ncbi:MAG: TetR/AcrR family transcriptional regulator [Cyclobacteriaceae bacterium]
MTNLPEQAWDIKVDVNEKLFLRDPEHTEVGKKILEKGVKMIDKLGLEDFTFKKLATAIRTNESSIYRYFENKHRLLLYLFQWYWRWMEYQLVFSLQNVTDPLRKIDIIIDLLVQPENIAKSDSRGLDKKALHRVVIKEASKAYLTHHVYEDNQKKFFKPYKDFCGQVANVILEYHPKYKFARSLSSTIVEMSHYQYYFMKHLPSLTDFGESKDEKGIRKFLEALILSCKYSA